MGKYLDRTSGKTDAGIQLPQSQESSTLAQDEDNPVFHRLQLALKYMVSKGNGIQGKGMTMKIVTKIMNEALEDMRDSGLHPDVMSMYIKQLSAMTSWIADGKWQTEIPMPEDFDI